MNEHDRYSDEYINSYVDGELDSDECARILSDQQEDDSLAQRINQIQMLKQKIQLAYPDIGSQNEACKPFSWSRFVSRNRSLAAGLFVLVVSAVVLSYSITSDTNLLLAKQLISNTRPIPADSIIASVGENKKTIIHLSQYDQSQFGNTIEQVESLLLQKKSDKTFSLELVANGQGLRVLDKSTSIFAERLTLLAKRFDSLEIVACAKSLANLAETGDPVQLIASIIITPSAAQQVATRLTQGWHYIKI